MSTASLFAWIGTVLVGLLLLVIWLMEYDPQFQSAAATRLPIPVISVHALLGMAGLLLWGAYLLADEDRLAYATLADLAIAVVLGLTMAARWIGVYRTYRAGPQRDPSATRVVTVPPERHFPLSAVLLHGVLAVTTVILVVVTVFTD
jgi:hypothetical protein